MSKCKIFKNSFDIENFNVAMKPNNQDCKINQCSQPTYNFIFKAFCCPCGPSYGLCNSDDTVYDVPPYILKMSKNKILENILQREEEEEKDILVTILQKLEKLENEQLKNHE